MLKLSKNTPTSSPSPPPPLAVSEILEWKAKCSSVHEANSLKGILEFNHT